MQLFMCKFTDIAIHVFIDFGQGDDILYLENAVAKKANETDPI